MKKLFASALLLTGLIAAAQEPVKTETQKPAATTTQTTITTATVAPAKPATAPTTVTTTTAATTPATAPAKPVTTKPEEKAAPKADPAKKSK